MTTDKRKGILAGYRKLGPTGRFVFWLSIASVLFTIVGFVLGVVSSEYYYIRSQRASRHLANVTMSRPVPFVRRFPVIVEDGTNSQTMPTPGRYSAAFSRTPFSFFITPDGTINLHGEIRDAEGNIVVEAVGDSVRVLQASRYDVNSDSKAIEVVDANQRPLFQLIVVPYEVFVKEQAQLHARLGETLRQRLQGTGIPDVGKLLANTEEQLPGEGKGKGKGPDEVIRLCYVAQQGETWLISSPQGSEMVKAMNEHEWSKLPRLFCYPGYLYPGKRVVGIQGRVEDAQGQPSK
jgi:hypothetical protein